MKRFRPRDTPRFANSFKSGLFWKLPRPSSFIQTTLSISTADMPEVVFTGGAEGKISSGDWLKVNHRVASVNER